MTYIWWSVSQFFSNFFHFSTANLFILNFALRKASLVISSLRGFSSITKAHPCQILSQSPHKNGGNKNICWASKVWLDIKTIIAYLWTVDTLFFIITESIRDKTSPLHFLHWTASYLFSCLCSWILFFLTVFLVCLLKVLTRRPHGTKQKKEYFTLMEEFKKVCWIWRSHLTFMWQNSFSDVRINLLSLFDGQDMWFGAWNQHCGTNGRLLSQWATKEQGGTWSSNVKTW